MRAARLQAKVAMNCERCNFDEFTVIVPDVGGMRLVQCDGCKHKQFARRQIPRGTVNGKAGMVQAAGAIDARDVGRFAGTIILRGRVDLVAGGTARRVTVYHHGGVVMVGSGLSKVRACDVIFDRIEREVLALGARFEFVLDLYDGDVTGPKRLFGMRPRFVARRICEGKGEP